MTKINLSFIVSIITYLYRSFKTWGWRKMLIKRTTFFGLAMALLTFITINESNASGGAAAAIASSMASANSQIDNQCGLQTLVDPIFIDNLLFKITDDNRILVSKQEKGFFGSHYYVPITEYVARKYSGMKILDIKWNFYNYNVIILYTTPKTP